jgi:type II secretory pathway pseudopilin PulG
MSVRKRQRSQAGFTLIETMIAIVILMVGILGLAAMLADGLAYMNMSQADYIAQQKAAAAVESIFTARDMGQATWNTICNVGSPVCSAGLFLTGAQPLCDPGADGIVGTADDYSGSTCKVSADAIIVPGSTGAVNATLGGGGGQRLALSTFTRTIAISAVAGVANLRQIQVTITYSSGRFSNRTYTMTTNISNFS